MSANNTQFGGNHYKKPGPQHWDWAAGLGYLEGNCTKYVGRWKNKNGVEDLKKALHYLAKIFEVNGFTDEFEDAVQQLIGPPRYTQPRNPEPKDP